MDDDSSIEFDMYEDVRQNLTDLLIGTGRDMIAAERIALYVVQVVKDVPKLLSAISDKEDDGDAALHLLENILDSAPTLEKARRIMHGLDQPGSKES